MRYFDIENWKRKEHFEFFTAYDEPFHGVCVQIDCTEKYSEAQQLQFSFFLSYLHAALIAINENEAFRLRLDNQGKVVIYDVVDASATIGRKDHTFGFSYIPFYPDFQKFQVTGNDEIRRVQGSTSLQPEVDTENVVYFSSLPWLNFTSISHARSFKRKSSVPMITFGKLVEDGSKKKMSVSIHVHHGLVDGYDVGVFVDRFQELMNMPF